MTAAVKKHTTKLMARAKRAALTTELNNRAHIKAHLILKYGERCSYCPSEDDLTLDHMVPLSRGGLTRASNSVLACRTCNQLKGNLKTSEWSVSASRTIVLSDTKELLFRTNVELQEYIKRNTPAPERLKLDKTALRQANQLAEGFFHNDRSAVQWLTQAVIRKYLESMAD